MFIRSINQVFALVPETPQGVSGMSDRRQVRYAMEHDI
jgi:hypothetical protein